MSVSDLFDGLWPRQGAKKTTVWDGLASMLDQNIKWGKDPVLGFPTMPPHPFGLAAFREAIGRHTNAILTHTRGDGEKGFDGVKTIERDLIMMMGDLLGSSSVDGYVTPGGTEANMMGLWIAREKLRQKHGDPSDQRVALLASPASHYSLRKACNLVDLGEGRWELCPDCVDHLTGQRLYHRFIPADDGSGLNFVEADQDGRMLVPALEKKIRWLLAEKGVNKFIIFLNEGATMTGAMDDTAGAGAIVSRLRSEWGSEVGFYVHADAAYGGLIYPFIDPEGQWAFRVEEVDSVTADPYKMGACPLAEGIFLCRKPAGEGQEKEGLQKYIQRRAGYVQNQHDDTLCGSRSGAWAAACWSVFRTLGFDGFAEMHRQSVEKARSLVDRLESIPQISDVGQGLNMVYFALPNNLSRTVLEQMEKEVIKRFFLMWDWFLTNPEDPSQHPRRMVRFNITKYTEGQWLDDCVESLSSILKEANQ